MILVFKDFDKEFFTYLNKTVYTPLFAFFQFPV